MLLKYPVRPRLSSNAHGPQVETTTSFVIHGKRRICESKARSLRCYSIKLGDEENVESLSRVSGILISNGGE